MNCDKPCGKILFLADLRAEAEEIQLRLCTAYKYHGKDKTRFSLSKQGVVCCYADKRVYGTDKRFNPILAYESESYVTACGISENSRYMVFQLARNNSRDADSGATVLFEVKTKKVLARRELPTGFSGANCIFIDEQDKEIKIYFRGGFVMKYDFDLLPNEDTLKEYYVQPGISPYEQNGRVNELLERVEQGECDLMDAEQEILPLLDILKASLKMSHYQLSMTYKRLGDLYANGTEVKKAMEAYEIGLVLNPKLSVKKALKRLKKEYPNIESPVPYIASIEREKAWEAEDYILPSTYTDYTEKRKIEIDPTSYQKSDTYRYLNTDDKKTADMMATVIWNAGNQFIDSLKTDAYKFMESIEGLNSMSDQAFSELFNKLCLHMDIRGRKEARKMAEVKIAADKHDGITIREEIVLEVYSMIKSFSGVDLNEVSI